MLRLGARTSPLARAQVELVGAALTARGVPWTFVGVTTRGDVDRRNLAEIGGTGLFVGAVRDALRAGSIDVAVHSLKDLPTGAELDLEVTAVPVREDTRDVLIGRRLADLRDGVRVGTGSPRRAMQLYDWAARSGTKLEVVPIRGNVDTRIRKMREGQADALILARAGLERLGLDAPHTVIPPEIMLPAVGQGALTVATLEDHPLLGHVREVFDHAPTHRAVLSERAMLRALEGGCRVPVGALGVAEGSVVRLRGVVISPDGVPVYRGEAEGEEPEEVGRRLARDLLDQGAAVVLGEVREVRSK